MRIAYLYRFPIKGLTAEALKWTELEPGKCIPWDRAFALAQGDAGFNPAQPEHRRARLFMCGKESAKISLLRSSFDDHNGEIAILAPDGSSVTANGQSPEGRAAIGAFLTAYLGAEARGMPAFHHVAGYSFSDQRKQLISLISLNSLADYEAKVGGRRHRRRFRANIWFAGAAPWVEFNWIGREIQVGGARLRVTQRIGRCAATEVNPETAARDADPVAELRHLYGHTDLGVYAEVIEGGKCAVGDAIEMMQE
ncbi:MAG: MOSC domain-containing protein [Acetobacteraceae bacterium]|nr:MOSC domain-containing protein [Acetobacteraceae bacterium]MSP29893.1 MOSC domain-containing protein [Acetobacteraceae bacterium]